MMKQNGVVLNINKPVGMTSFQVVEKVRRITGEKKVGHAGTLDPVAEGVLIILVGRGATKRFQEFMTLPKTYETTIRLGMSTNTHDLDGEVLADHVVTVDIAQIQAALEEFRGRIQQVPPMYSAKKVSGERLYKLANQGKTVEREPAEVTIYELTLLDRAGQDVRLRVRCSKGTYIRALARDIGAELGTDAVVAQLTRTAVGQYNLDNAIPMDNLERRWSYIAA
ncbi:MAG TPA: tRNA pseudouridine(55) synthase TruB [bacterium]|nr:tRNA pseudouridine(55) synthase TruB [bacterium]